MRDTDSQRIGGVRVAGSPLHPGKPQLEAMVESRGGSDAAKCTDTGGRRLAEPECLELGRHYGAFAALPTTRVDQMAGYA